MKRKYIVFLLVILFVSIGFTQNPVFGLVEWNIRNTLKLDTQPLDVAVSQNGNLIYVLTKSEKILIYSSSGQLKDEIKVGNHVDHINSGPTEEWLFLSSRNNKTVEILHLDFIRQIDISGSPFRGPENAPIAITVFSDFQ